MNISNEALEARREYMRKYRQVNKEKILKQQREHYHHNKEKYKEYQAKYWQRKAQEAAGH